MERTRTSPRLSFSEREKKILNSALKLFSRKGFKGCTTRSIAQDAGVNEALLFRHFPSKAKLYDALLEKKLREAEIYFAPAAARAQDLPLREGLLYLGQMILARFKKDTSFFRMALYSALEQNEFSRLIFRRRLPLPELLKEFFSKKIREGEIRSEDPESLATTFFAMIHHYTLLTAVFKAQDYFPKGEKEMLKDFVRILLEGIAP